MGCEKKSNKTPRFESFQGVDSVDNDPTFFFRFGVVEDVELYLGFPALFTSHPTFPDLQLPSFPPKTILVARAGP